MSKLFSLIIPSYNSDKLLTRCLMSIDIDIFQHNEVIVVDDGSKINQKNFIPKDRYKYIKFIRGKNKGLSEARNIGINASNGEFLIFIDSDDYIDSNEFNKLTDKILTFKNIDACNLIRCGYEWLKNNNEIVIKRFKKEKWYKSIDKYVFDNFLWEMKSWSTWTHIYKREFIVKNNLYFKKGLLAEDLEHLMRSYQVLSGVLILPINFYTYDNTNQSSLMNNNYGAIKKDVLNTLKEYKTIKNKYLKLLLICVYYNQHHNNIEKIKELNAIHMLNAFSFKVNPFSIVCWWIKYGLIYIKH